MPQGSILHPSIYMIFDECNHILLNSIELAFCYEIQKSRSLFLPEVTFWESRDDAIDMEAFPIRILVIGNTGVGKSTLINKVFGTELVRSCASSKLFDLIDYRLQPLIEHVEFMI